MLNIFCRFKFTVNSQAERKSAPPKVSTLFTEKRQAVAKCVLSVSDKCITVTGAELSAKNKV